MKLFCLSILYKGADNKVHKLVAAHELNQFGYFQRGSVKEFMDFTSKIIVERTSISQRASVKEQEIKNLPWASVVVEVKQGCLCFLARKHRAQSVGSSVHGRFHFFEYMCHAYVRSDSLAGVLISDHEYPQRVAFTLLNKVLDDFAAKVPPTNWPSATEGSISFSECEEFLSRYQNPKEADAMTKLQTDLDETKIILHNTIDAVLQRGEKLDDLVEKSEGLSMQSKTFYKTAKKTNSCCTIL